jgi:V/A-type H+-transporting ATPase subunit K
MYYFLTLAIFIVIITITTGVIKFYKRTYIEKKDIKRALKFNIYSIIPVMTGLIITAIPQVANAATGDSGSGLGYIAAALSTGLATIGAGYAVGAVGSSALGAVSEDPTLLGKTLIYVGLAEGIAIYGLIISIMILQRL